MPRGGQNRKLTDAQEQEVVSLYTTPAPDGTWIGAVTIAEMFGVTDTTVQNVLRRRSIPMRNSREAYTNGKRTKPIKNLPQGDPPMCKCGCGQLVGWNQRKNRWNVFVDGHYRKDAPYKSPDWLRQQYVDAKRAMQEIANEFGVNKGIVHKFMRKFGIPSRNRSTAKIGRQAGSSNPAWKGGTTPERQRVYKSQNWKAVLRAVYKRDNYTCQRCGSPKLRRKGLHAHHIQSWSEHPDLRTDLTNLVTLCDDCHRWVHSAENINRDFIKD